MSADPVTAPQGAAQRAGFAATRGRALLSLVPPPVRARRAPFVALLLVLLASGLVSLLLLNTASAQDAFRLHSLQSQQALLDRQRQQFASPEDGLDDPARLAYRASKLGLVPGGAPVFLAKGQPIPKGGIRLGNLIYVPGVVPVVPAPPVVPQVPPAVTPAAKQPVKAKPVKAKPPVTAKLPVKKALPRLPTRTPATGQLPARKTTTTSGTARTTGTTGTITTPAKQPTTPASTGGQ